MSAGFLPITSLLKQIKLYVQYVTLYCVYVRKYVDTRAPKGPYAYVNTRDHIIDSNTYFVAFFGF